MSVIKSINDFKAAKLQGTPISMITCYDHAMARLVAQTDIDTILVGDSLGNVVAGYASTLPVTMEQMIYHAEIVRRGAPEKFIIADLPFMSYHVSIEESLRNSGEMMKRTGANAVKLEGGRDFCRTVEALVKASIPVCGHLGFTPQSLQKFGGHKVQGRDADQRRIIMEDARMLEEAGAFALVLEMVPEELATAITKALTIPTIGIGAGRYTDGQVLVINDCLGMDERFNPKFLKKYADLSTTIRGALQAYSDEVRSRAFPAEKNAFQ